MTFRECRRGSLPVLFALSTLPILLTIGAALDYMSSLSAKTTLDRAVDAAALAATGEAQKLLRSGATEGQATTAAKQAANDVFTAEVAGIGSRLKVTPAITTDVAVSTTTVAATVATGDVVVPAVMSPLGMLGSLSVKASSTARLKLARYINIALAIDISQSMGFAATEAEGKRLFALVGCEFGCHVPGGGQTVSNQAVAKANGISLRVDVARTAARSMIASAKAASSGSITLGLYTLQAQTPVAGTVALKTLAAPTNDYAALTTAATGIDLGNNDGSVGYGDSDLKSGIAGLTAALPTSGSGVSSVSPIQYAFLVTDGVQDTTSWSCAWTHCTSPVDPAWCDGLKAKGITVGVLYTTFVPAPNEAAYNVLVAPFASQIAPQLKSCASPGWFYEASDTPTITAALDKLFLQASGISYIEQ